MKKYVFLFIGCLSSFFFNSCSKKNDTASPVILSTEQFIRYSINGVNYSFTKPTDNVFSANQLNNPQPPPTTLVFANRVPSSTTDYVNIQFERTGLTAGSTPVLSFFYTQFTDFYPIVSTSTLPIKLTITEYGNIGEYIAGNFSAVITGPAPNSTPYNVTCSFRVKRIV
ncbi:MAG: hypothetical protein WBP16_03590 [Ferruginibacter sp.]